MRAGQSDAFGVSGARTSSLNERGRVIELISVVVIVIDGACRELAVF